MTGLEFLALVVIFLAGAALLWDLHRRSEPPASFIDLDGRHRRRCQALQELDAEGDL